MARRAGSQPALWFLAAAFAWPAAAGVQGGRAPSDAGSAALTPTPLTISGPARLNLRAYWLPAAGSGPHPAVIALHGCGGLHNARGALSQRYRDYAARWHAQGISVLLPDSWGPRGLTRVCQTPYRERGAAQSALGAGNGNGNGEGARASLPAARRADVRAAFDWLAAQPGVAPDRIALVGWSNGGSTALSALDGRHGPVPPLAGAAVFYPGCRVAQTGAAHLARVPLLMQLGADDDWTPPAPCEALAADLRVRGHDVTLRSYPGAYHGFDGTEKLRLRADVPNGVHPGGVHQGGQPAARAAALGELDAFLQRVLRLPAAAAESPKP